MEGAKYAEETLSFSDTFEDITVDETDDYSSSDPLIQDLEAAIGDDKNDFAYAIKADDETSSGALADANNPVELLIYFTEKPTAPILTSPADGDTVVSGGAVTLDWGASDGHPQPTYEVQLDNSPKFNSPRVEPSSLTQEKLGGLTDGTQYYWRVVASNFEGADTSSVRTFTFVQELSSPTLTAKKEGGHPLLDWSSVDKAQGYVVHRMVPSKDIHEEVPVEGTTYKDGTVYSSYLKILDQPSYDGKDVHYYVEATNPSLPNTESSEVYYNLGNCIICAYGDDPIQ